MLKEEEDQLLPHKRKRKPKDIEIVEDHNEEPQQKKSKTDLNSEKSKKRPPQPPPLNFHELLKIAEKKQFEPIIIEKPKKEESLPMMTKKEREKYLEEKRFEANRAARRQGKCVPSTEKPKDLKPIEVMQRPTASSTKIDIHAEEKLKKNASVWSKDFKVSKELNNNSKNEKYVPRSLNSSESVGVKVNGVGNRTMSKSSLEKNSLNEKKYSSNDERYSPKPKTMTDKYIPRMKNSIEDNYSPKPKSLPNSDRYVPKFSNSSSDKYSPNPKSVTPSDKYSSKPIYTEKYVPKPNIVNDEKYFPKYKSTTQPEKYVPKGKASSSADQYIPSAVKCPDEKYIPKSMSSQSMKSKPNGSKDKYVPMPVDKSKKLPPSNNMKPKDLTPKQFPPRDMVPKQFPPRDMMPKQFPPRDMIPKQFPPSDMRRRDDRYMPIRNKRQVIESDSEYDSELDDFIDDGPEDDADYSKVISEIFKYDKSKYIKYTYLQMFLIL